jgi:hypothetical protein
MRRAARILAGVVLAWLVLATAVQIYYAFGPVGAAAMLSVLACAGAVLYRSGRRRSRRAVMAAPATHLDPPDPTP